MPWTKYRVIVLLVQRSDIGIDLLVVVLLGAVVRQQRDGCGGTGEFDRLTGLGIEESFWRWRTQS